MALVTLTLELCKLIQYLKFCYLSLIVHIVFLGQTTYFYIQACPLFFSCLSLERVMIVSLNPLMMPQNTFHTLKNDPDLVYFLLTPSLFEDKCSNSFHV